MADRKTWTPFTAKHLAAQKAGCSHPGNQRGADAGIVWCHACGNALQGTPSAFAELLRACVRVGGRP